MGIPGLINAIGTGERISLSKLAITHLERTARPIRVAVDISIWLFQVQAGRGGKNPELRTLFYRLLKFLALPIHPLFVYDGRHKPPFKRGKAVSARSYGNAPIIQRSKDLIERFRYPWHEAPGEAEAECARLQRAGIVDAVMSNDVDALMFGSTLTIMNFSKESGSGTSASTHVTCYGMGQDGHLSNVPLERAGMILFAMLSGGDYLPSGVPKCGSKLAAEIAKAGFGEDLLNELASHDSDLNSRLNEWRDRLQYELEENESGYFTTKHKAVRIPETFPDRTILEYYAQPKVSDAEEMKVLKNRLKHAWDREIDPSAIKAFAAEHFEWNYRSGARKVIKLLAEPLVSYRLRLQRPVSALPLGMSLAPDCDTPTMQKIYRSRTSFGTDGMVEVQTDMLPIDVVGLDLFVEEPNPPLPSQETVSSQNTVQSGDEEEDPEVAAEAPPPTPSKSRLTKRFDPYSIEKVWVFETVARLGVPEVVKKWEDEQAAKNEKAAARKMSTNRRTGPKKKGPIDPGMKRGSILKYGTLTKEKSELSTSKQAHLLESATSATSTQYSLSSSGMTSYVDLADEDPFAPAMYMQQQSPSGARYSFPDIDELLGTFSSMSIGPPASSIKRHPMAGHSRSRARRGVLGSDQTEIEDTGAQIAMATVSPSWPAVPKGIKMSYSVTGSQNPTLADEEAKTASLILPLPSTKEKFRQRPKGQVRNYCSHDKFQETAGLENAMASLSLTLRHEDACWKHTPTSSSCQTTPKKAIQKPELCAHSPEPKSGQKSLSLERVAPVTDRPSSATTPTMSQPHHRIEVRHTPRRSQSCHDDNPEKGTMQRPKDSSEAKGQHLNHEQATTGHIENISTCEGFWTVHAVGPELASGSGTREDASAGEIHNAGGSQGKQGKQKRIPRVSILNMI